MGDEIAEPVTLEIDDVTIKFRGQWADAETDQPRDDEDGAG